MHDNIDSYPFHIEQWDDRDLRVTAVLAVASNLSIARAAYLVALKERPKWIVRLRKQAFVVEERMPEGCRCAEEGRWRSAKTSGSTQEARAASSGGIVSRR